MIYDAVKAKQHTLINRCADCLFFDFAVCKWRRGKCKKKHKHIDGTHHACDAFKYKWRTDYDRRAN